MNALVLLALIAVVVVFVLPIVAMVKATDSKNELERLKLRVDDLVWELQRLRQRLELTEQSERSTEGEPAPLERPVPTAADVAVALGTAESPPPVAAAELPRARAETEAVPARKAQPPALPPVERPRPLPPPLAPAWVPVEGQLSEPTAPARVAPPAFDWEAFMGAKLYAWLGGLALFLAAAYFVKYSFEHNLIPPWVRVTLGFVLGGGLVVGGYRMKQRAYLVTSQTLCATGVVILYAVTFACRAYYHFPAFGLVPTFLLMSGITAGAFLLAVRLEAQVVAVLGMLGGFVTPALLSTGQDNPAVLFSYVGLLDAGLVAVALARPWPWLVALGALGTAVTQTVWALRFFAPTKLTMALVVLLAFDGLFLLASELARWRHRAATWWNGTATGIAVASFLFALGFLEVPTIGQRPGALGTLLLGADLCLLVLALRERAWGISQLAGGALAFFCIGIWAMRFLTPSSLGWMLGGVLVFALLHSVVPALAARRLPLPHHSGVERAWTRLFPLVALALIFVPVAKLSAVSFFIWPVVLCLDLLAIAMAVVMAELITILAALALTALVAAFWMFGTPVADLELGATLVVIGGMAALFLLAGLWATQHLLAGASAPSGEGSRASRDNAVGELAVQLPAAAGIFPFILLVLVVVRLPLSNPSPVFGLALALVILMLGVGRAFRQSALGLVGLVSVVLLQSAWQLLRFQETDRPLVALLWHVAFGLLFVGFPFLSRKQFEGSNLPWIAAAVSLPLHFPLVYRTVERAWPNEWMGVVPAAAAIPLLAAVWQVHRWFPRPHAQRDTLLAWLGGAALLFITAIFPVQFERQWITVGWVFEGAALCWLYHRVPHPGLARVGFSLLGGAFVRLALNPHVLEYHPRAAVPIWNWYLYAYGLTSVGLFAGARALAPPRNRIGKIQAPAVLYTMATILVFLLVNLEIADYFTRPGEAVLTFRFSGNFARDMSYTVSWAAFALALVIGGIRLTLRPVRYAGLALLGIAILKLFFHDLAHLHQLYRIGALAIVAVIAMLASFLYQKFLAASRPATALQGPDGTPSAG